MNLLNTRLFLWIAATCLLAGLAGCNLPGETSEPPPVGEFTQAAQTVAAQLTEVALPTGLASTQTPAVLSPEPILSDTPVPVPTASHTPTATATPVPAPTESLTLLFSDDFSSQAGWYTTEGDQFGFSFALDGYLIYVNIAEANIWSIRDNLYSGVVSEVEAVPLAGAQNGYFGLVCRHVDDNNYYGLVIGSDGFYGIGKMKDGEFEFLQEGLDSGGIILTETQAINKIRADCQGSNLRLSANGQALLEVQDSDFSEGASGLLVGSRQEPGLNVLFDNYAVYQPGQ